MKELAVAFKIPELVIRERLQATQLCLERPQIRSETDIPWRVISDRSSNVAAQITGRGETIGRFSSVLQIESEYLK